MSTFCFPVKGGPRLVPTISDFTRSQPGRPSSAPAGAPAHRGAPLRVRQAKGGDWVPVDPAFLLLHIEIGDGGAVVQLSQALAAFILQCCTDRPGKRLRVAGPPAPATRAVRRVSEVSVELRCFFTTGRCAVSGCGTPAEVGNFCPAHLDARFHNGLRLREAAVPPRGSLAAPARVAAEVAAIGHGFPGWWSAMAAWLVPGGAHSAADARRFFVNWALDALPAIAVGTAASPDRLALLAYAAPRKVQKVQTFLNAATTVQFLRGIQTRAPAAARDAAAALSQFGVYGLGLEDRAGALFRDRGLVPFLSMPVLPALLRRGWTGLAGLVCATILPAVSSDQPDAVAVFSGTMALVMAHLLGFTGEFSFSVLHGPPPDPPGPVLDAADPVSLRTHLASSGEARARSVLTVVNPAAMSPTVLAEIIFTLGYMHVRFCGPRLGRRGVRLPTFVAGGELEPAAGFLWGVIQAEAASRKLVTAPPAADAGGVFADADAPGNFLAAFVRETTPVRCSEGCARCSATSGWHRDRLLMEFAFRDSPTARVPECAVLGVDTATNAEFSRALLFFRSICDASVGNSTTYLDIDG